MTDNNTQNKPIGSKENNNEDNSPVECESKRNLNTEHNVITTQSEYSKIALQDKDGNFTIRSRNAIASNEKDNDIYHKETITVDSKDIVLQINTDGTMLETQPQQQQQQTDTPKQSKNQLNESKHSNGSKLCRICYEEATESNKLIQPCQCTGTCQHIHEQCLRTWIETSYIQPTAKINPNSQVRLPKPKCELCDWEYLFRFSFKLHLSSQGKCEVAKASVNYFILYLVFLFSLGAVVYLIVTAIVNLTTEERNYLIYGLVGGAAIVLIILMIREVRLLRLKKMKMSLIEWGVFSYDENMEVLTTESKENMTQKDKQKEKEMLKWVPYLEEAKWYTCLIYRKKQVNVIKA